METKDVKSAFYALRFTDCLALLERFTSSEYIGFKIGSYIFTGQYSEAKVFYEIKKSELNLDQTIECEFYLGIGEVRRSNYQAGASFFAKNLLRIHQNKVQEPSARFYAYQGAAFLMFFKGHYDRSEEKAELAYQSALEAEFIYGQVLALDLLAHSHCQRGKIRQGLHEFEKALKLIKKIGKGGLETALMISRIKYRAQFGISEDGVLELEDAIRTLSPEETYSRSELKLELVRQLILRGKGTEARVILEGASDEIYRHQNKRQSAQYNHRLAHILFLRGEVHSALALIRASKPQLNPSIDLTLLSQFKGLEDKVLSFIGQSSSVGSAIHSSSLDERISKRGARALSLRGEDPLGDLMDDLREGGRLLLPMLIQKNYLGLIPEALGTNLQGKKIFIGPSRGQMILIADSDVIFVSSGLTSPLSKLLLHLTSTEFQSKEILIRSVWGHEYDPLIHDNTLYSNIAKLRNLFGRYHEWIEWNEKGYRLSPGIKIIRDEEKTIEKSDLVLEKKTEVRLQSSLNLRQLEILRSLEQGHSVNVRAHSKRFGVTTMTACRDLSTLFKLGLIMRVGRGRGTNYLKRQSQIGQLV